MYCKECGNLLDDTDLICRVCGSETGGQQNAAQKKEASFQSASLILGERNSAALVSSGFTPPESSEHNPGPAEEPQDETAVRIHLEGPTEKTNDETDELKADAILDHWPETANITPNGEKLKIGEEFQWNVRGFPGREPRKTDDIDFNWNPNDLKKTDIYAYAERASVQSELEKEIPARLAVSETRDGDSFFMKTEQGQSEEGFGGGAGNNDKFFTFNRKNEEFQKLLDEEYERLKQYDTAGMTEARKIIIGEDDPPLENDLKSNANTSSDEGRKSASDIKREAAISKRIVAESEAIPPETAVKAAEKAVETEDAASGFTGDGNGCDIGAPTEQPASGSQSETADDTNLKKKNIKETSLPTGQNETDKAGKVVSARTAGIQRSIAIDPLISKAFDALEIERRKSEKRRRGANVWLTLLIFILLAGASAAVIICFFPESAAAYWINSAAAAVTGVVENSLYSIRALFASNIQ
ncbi:MAG: hypothetical protein LBT34_01870 [Clostridiales Family XIII bacterium]|jgi:hypothetical protein|nr:hypothetical protein [Clostridiales Family XIII bacterium]